MSISLNDFDKTVKRLLSITIALTCFAYALASDESGSAIHWTIAVILVDTLL
jgi:hypothetical protein